MSVNKYTTASGLQTLANGSRIWVGTKAAYEAARQAGTMPTDVLVAITDDEQQAEATQISYDNTDSGLTADNVQNAINEVVDNFNASPVLVPSGSDISNYKELYIITVIGGYKMPRHTSVAVVKAQGGLLWTESMYVTSATNYRGQFALSISNNNILSTSATNVYINGSQSTGDIYVYAK